MAKSCRITPMVKSPSGTEVESKLYNDMKQLMSTVGDGSRSKVLPLYQKTLDPQFKSDIKERGAEFDENGEPTLYDVINLTTIGNDIPQEKIMSYLKKDADIDSEKTFENTRENRDILLEKINAFNDSRWGSSYVARMLYDEGGLHVSIEEKDDSNSDIQPRTKYFSRLSTKLASILKSWGIAITDLTELEEATTNGYTQFENAPVTADGLIALIKLARGQKGEKYLPEEFSHFVVRSMINTPLMTRLINFYSQNERYKDVLGDEFVNWNIKYKGDERKLAEEAVTHLLMEKIIEADSELNENNLLDRVVNLFRKMYSKFNDKVLKQAAIDADKGLGVLARDIINGKYKHLQTESLGKGKMHHARTLYAKMQNQLQQIYNTTVKRQYIYEQRKKDLGLTSDPEFDKEFIIGEQSKLIKELDKIINTEDWSKSIIPREQYIINTISHLLKNAINDIERLESMMTNLKESIDNGTYKSTMNSAAAKLRMVQDYQESYDLIVDMLTQLMADDFKELNVNDGTKSELKELINGQIGELEKSLRLINAQYQKTAVPIFVKALSDICPEGAMLTFGYKNNGDIMTLEDIVLKSDNDITFMSRWLNSMANTNDDILKLYDHIVKIEKGKARDEQLDIKRRIVAAGKKLDSKFGFGARQQEFMYRHNEDGTIFVDDHGTPQYIKAYNYASYLSAYQDFKNSVIRKYEKLSPEEADEKISEEIREWKKQNVDIRRGLEYPKPSKFPSSEYLALTPEQKEFYDTFMELKRQVDKYIPIGTNDSLNAICVRKDAWEKILTSKFASREFWVSIIDLFKEKLTYVNTDDEFGSTTKTAIQDFSGRHIKQLPIYYVHTHDIMTPANDAVDYAKLNVYSLDCVSNLVVYSQMATNYKAMNGIINTLELGRDLLNAREFTEKHGIQELVSRVRAAGKTIEELIGIDAGKTHFMGRLDSFMNMQVYGEMKKRNEIVNPFTGKVLNISNQKLVNLWLSYIALRTTAVNLYVGVTNVLQGLGQINIEMLASQYFSMGDIIKAKSYYWRYIWPSILESNSPAKKYKLSLLSEDFNILQDHESKMHEVDFYKRNQFYRMCNSNIFFLLNHIGEHYMQHLTAFAVMNNTKLVDADGNEISIMDAYETKWIDPSDHSLGAYLTLKTYTDKNGVQRQSYKFGNKIIISKEQLKERQKSMPNVDLYSKKLLWSDNEIAEYDFKNYMSRKMAKLNQDMHGIYNQEDKNALQQNAMGGIIMMYRKHIAPNFMKRWKSGGYDFDLDEYTIGYQREFFSKVSNEIAQYGSNVNCFRDVFGEAAKEIKKMVSAKTWLGPEGANMRRNLAQLLNFILIQGAILAFDDDDDDDWLKKVFITNLYRTRAENSQFTIASFTTQYNMLSEWWRIIKEPVIGLNIAEQIGNLFTLFSPSAWYTEYTKGDWKGFTYAEKSILQLIPGINQYFKLKHPNLNYYKGSVIKKGF